MGRIHLSAPLCAVMLAAAGCTTAATTPDVVKTVANRAEAPEDLLKEAEADVATRRFQLAEQRLARIEKPLADSPRVQYAAAEVLLGLEQPKAALDKFQALQSDPEYAACAWQGMGLSLMALNDVTAAQAPLQKAVAADPGLWRAWTGLGRAYDQQHRWHEAEDAYNKALAAKPDAAMVVNNIGMSQLLQRRYTEAAETFQKALAADPALDIARSNLRIALAWQGRYDEALVGTDSTTRTDALNNVGYIAMLRGDYEAAQKFLSQALEGSPTYHEQAARNLDMLRLMVKSQGKVEDRPTTMP
jgi:Flp pilus assembly protein TadD